MKEKAIKLIEAALIHFERDGYHDAKISDIAKSANVGKGTVYEYFSSKQDLFDQMVNYILDESQNASILALSKIDDPVQALRHLIYLDWVVTRDHWHLMHVMLTRLSEMNDLTQCRLVEARESSIKLIENILQKGIDRNLFIKHDTRLVALMIKGSFNQAIMDIKLLAIKDHALLNDDMFYKQTSHIFDIFINNILKP